ncbi:inner centromere protein [Pelodiscus sinensis]|uniref:inner centromere protein n=1 Tax=Pelodiscus sinensis TaxID=13735 RepID=UPI003F6B07E7
MEPASGPAHLPALCNRKLAEFLRQVDAVDMVWLREIGVEAAKMFSSSFSDEPELMPKTPSQKNRVKRRLSNAPDENKDPIRKRLSRSAKRASAKRYSRRLRSKENLEITRAMQEVIPLRRVTRSRAVVSDARSVAPPQKSAVEPVDGRVPFVNISVNDRNSAELCLKRNSPETEARISKVIVLSSDDDSPKKAGTVKLQPAPAPSVLLIPETTEPKGSKEGRSASKLKIANTAITKAIVNREPATEEMDISAQKPEDNQESVKEPSQDLKDGTHTPTGSKSNRHSVRRSLMCRTSMSHQTSLAEKFSLASKRESMIRKSVSRARSKRIAARQSSLASSHANCHGSVESLKDEEKTVPVRSEQGLTTPSKEDPRGPRNAKRAGGKLVAEQPEGSNKENHSDAQEQPPSARRKPSYKKAVDELYDGQQAAEGGLSPPSKKTPSPLCPASKVVRPFKTFLHTVQKNQLLMAPSSVGRNSIKKSFIKHNTPLRTDPKEKERQRLESLRKKQEAEQQRKQKLEEEKRQRLEEMKLKREARLRKVLQARERVEQMEEEKKRRIEQKLAQFDEKSEKVREERLAEEKVKKKVAAKKMEEVEARRRQEEEARKQKAQQLEEEERRQKERMQKKREEEEQERARKIAEQRQAEQEREKQLAAERELERKKEQERIQAERERERQEKEMAARVQRELMAAREKEQLQKEMEEKEKKRQEEQRLAEQEKKAANAASNHLNVTVEVENSPVCNSYQMTPQGPKGPKPPTINPNNYGMDLNSDDSTDDESQPRKPIPAWANGTQLSQAVIHQYYKPPDVTTLFGAIISPKLEDIFYKNKPRYFKRTSSAVWNSPPFPGAKSVLSLPYGLKKY